MNKKFFGSASVVTSADCFVLNGERRACVDGLGSTAPVVGIALPIIYLTTLLMAHQLPAVVFETLSPFYSALVCFPGSSRVLPL